MLFARGNDAIDFNPTTSDGTLTTHGSDFYWAFFSLFAVSTIVYGVFTARKPSSERIFYNMFLAVSVITALTYFTMAANLGQTPITVEYSSHQVDGTREIFYARFIGWFLTAPIVLSAVLLLTDLHYSEIGFAVMSNEIWVLGALIGSLVSSLYKWGYFTFGVAGLIYVTYVLFMPGRRAVARVGDSDVSRVYIVSAGAITFIGYLYPLAWALTYGANVLSLDSEAVFFGVLDLIIVSLGFYFTWAIPTSALSKLGLVENLRGRVTSEAKTVPPRTSDATAA